MVSRGAIIAAFQRLSPFSKPRDDAPRRPLVPDRRIAARPPPDDRAAARRLAVGIAAHRVSRRAGFATVGRADRGRSRNRLSPESRGEPAAPHVHGRGACRARGGRANARNMGRRALRGRRAFGAREDRVGDARRQARDARSARRVRAVVSRRPRVLGESGCAARSGRRPPHRQLRVLRPARRADDAPRVAARARILGRTLDDRRMVRVARGFPHVRHRAHERGRGARPVSRSGGQAARRLSAQGERARALSAARPSRAIPHAWDRTASCFVLRASCFVLRASCFVLRASCFVLRASCFVLRAAGCGLRAACCVLRAACCVLRAAGCGLRAPCDANADARRGSRRREPDRVRMRGRPNTMPREPPPPKEKRRIDQFPSRQGSHAGGHDSPPPRTTRHARPARRDTRPAMHRTPGRRPGVPPRHSTDFTISSMTFFASPKTIIVLSM
ncbi:hypothetical protein BURPS1710b_3391 [Burkholderia pseudomallei 1710b]|uniref:Uncharacterized protein n=1 Tax=Burkholderia pseudomallei (strain 1710b) TaxID=320372 RepID=Q3JNU2_BURP1|nr:hypothetical protein BURPS1710b_3391 [Burkholderia pseudomallei 1710b]